MTSHYDSVFCLFYLVTCTFSIIIIIIVAHRAESFAELFYHGGSVSLIKYQASTTQTLVPLMAFLLLSLSKLLNSLSSNDCLSIR